MKGLVTIHDGIADVRFTASLDVSGDTSISAILPSLSNIVGFQSPLDSMGLAIDGRTVPRPLPCRRRVCTRARGFRC